MTILEIQNLNLGFSTEAGFKQALWDVSFSLKKGQTHALVGESGCGKTISAMSVLKLLPKTAKILGGKILFKGENLLEMEEKPFQKIRGAQIALIPQDPMTSLNPLYTVGNQLLEVISLHQNLKGQAAEKKAVEALDMVQIPSAKERLNAYPHEFSGGMKQRAIIAMALACNAEVIIADEPTTALDVTIQAQIMNLLNNIKRELNTAILLITHDLALVRESSDEISVMYAGKIVENSPVEEFFQNTNHPYSRALLKALPADKFSQKGEKLAMIHGQPPSISEVITGCKFHPRCELAMPTCSEICPQLKEVSHQHTSACLLN